MKSEPNFGNCQKRNCEYKRELHGGSKKVALYSVGFKLIYKNNRFIIIKKITNNFLSFIH